MILEPPDPDGVPARPEEGPTGDDRGARRDDQPVAIGGVPPAEEEALRVALRAEAERIAPHHRLDAILAAGHPEAGVGSPRRFWLMPVAAAAAAVVLVGGVLLVNHRPSASSTLVGGPTVTSAISPGSTSPSTGSGPTSSTLPTQSAIPPVTVVSPAPTPPASTSAPVAPPTSTSPPTTSAPTTSAPTTSAPTTSPPSAPPSAPPAPSFVSAAVPVYYVGSRPGGGQSLYREFVSARVASPAGPENKVMAALTLAMSAPPSGSGYVAPWSGVDVSSVAVQPGAIVVGLTRGLSGMDAGQAQVAVQQLVWTATAAAGRGALPIRFELAGGGAELAPGQPVSRAYSRPTDPGQVFTLLSPLWIEGPSRGEVLPASGQVTVTGIASTFEGSVSWQLLRGGAVVDQGTVTATQAAPLRGGFTVPLGQLPAGDYVVRVSASSPKDGSVTAEAKMPFTTR